ncbi:MAG: hypothetical protein ACI90V_011085, partial [Bacillariaceae sp.]
YSVEHTRFITMQVCKAGTPTRFLGKRVSLPAFLRSGYAPSSKNTLSKKTNYLVSTKPPKIISAARPCYFKEEI